MSTNDIQRKQSTGEDIALKYYSLSQAAEILGFSKRTLHRWMKQTIIIYEGDRKIMRPKIKAIQVEGRWLIPASELRRLLKNRKH